ncbi:MAG: 3-phosphoshikimate 1-carboxyvinyltransferase [Clostridia bacterium]|nr:3-phosphoshikimate 1-carboxyvinyltransferase [Clostridia bacterium]
MNRLISATATGGSVRSIASKSEAHRLLILAAFADRPCRITCEEVNDDILATVSCLNTMGASIQRDGVDFCVTPAQALTEHPLLNAKESGSTLRFLVPVVCALGKGAVFEMAGRLPERPLSPLREVLEAEGIRLSETGQNPLRVSGQLQHRDFAIPANVSSQFISGLLFAIAVSGKTGSVTLLGKQESAPYVDMTIDAMAQFGLSVMRNGDRLEIRENQGLHAPQTLRVGGDWSGAAFPLCLGAIGSSSVSVHGLDIHSRQGDRAVLDVLRRFGALVLEEENIVTVSPASLRGIDIDASQIPDLVPILAVVASTAKGTTVISGAARLRIKESDRLAAIRQTLNALGGEVIETSDGLIIHGKEKLLGGSVSSFGDHRIAMSAAIASAACKAPVTLEGAEAVTKSYPAFWQDMRFLGIVSEEIGKEV